MGRKIFRYKKEDGTDDWRKFYNENLHKFYSSPDIIKIIKSRTVKSAGSFSTRGRNKNAYKLLAGKPEVLFKDLGIDGILMSK
jgi:hypothetical protein